MNINSKLKNEAIKKIKKIVFKMIKPFLPFVIIIVFIIFAICTVLDSLFTTDEDMEVVAKLYTTDYEMQYEEWLNEKELSPNEIVDGKGLIPTRNVHLANSKIHKNNI